MPGTVESSAESVRRPLDMLPAREYKIGRPRARSVNDSGSVMRRRVLLVLLASLVVVLTPMAYATPPDPSWIRGLYDDGDFDDVVVLLISGVGLSTAFALSELPPLLIEATPLAERDWGAVSNRSPSANLSRAPPAF